MTVQLVVDGKIVPLSPPGKINSKVARQAALTYLSKQKVTVTKLAVERTKDGYKVTAN